MNKSHFISYAISRGYTRQEARQLWVEYRTNNYPNVKRSHHKGKEIYFTGNVKQVSGGLPSLGKKR